MQRSVPAQHAESPSTGSPHRVVSLDGVRMPAPMLHAMVDLTMNIESSLLGISWECQTIRKILVLYHYGRLCGMVTDDEQWCALCAQRRWRGYCRETIADRNGGGANGKSLLRLRRMIIEGFMIAEWSKG